MSSLRGDEEYQAAIYVGRRMVEILADACYWLSDRLWLLGMFVEDKPTWPKGPWDDT